MKVIDLCHLITSYMSEPMTKYFSHWFCRMRQVSNLKIGVARNMSLLCLTATSVFFTACSSPEAPQETTEPEVIETTTQDNSLLNNTKTQALESTSVDAPMEAASEVIASDSDTAATIEDTAPIEQVKTERNAAPLIDEADVSDMGATLIGDFSGILPCNTCDLIKVSLSLHADGTVKKTVSQEPPEHKRSSIIKTGTYQQVDDTIYISYITGEKERFLINDNHLIFLDIAMTDGVADNTTDAMLSQN